MPSIDIAVSSTIMDDPKKSIDWCETCGYFSCYMCGGNTENRSWQTAASQTLDGENFVRLMHTEMDRCQNEDMSSSYFRSFLSYISLQAKKRPELKQAVYDGASYDAVLSSLISYRIDTDIKEVREEYLELSLKRLLNMCSEIFYLLSHNLNIIPDVLLGNMDDITTDHMKLALMVVTKLSQQEHSWTSMGYTQYVILCKHISSHCQKIGEKKAHVEKLMLQAKPPADYLRFMKRRNDDVYELLSVNGNRIGWTLYTECEMLDLLKIMELSVENEEEMEVEELSSLHREGFDFVIDRGDVESDDSEEDNPVNNPANKFNSKAPSNTDKKKRNKTKKKVKISDPAEKKPEAETEVADQKKRQRKKKKVKLSDPTENKPEDRGDGMSDDAEEDNPVLVTEAVEEDDENTQVNNPASEFDSKVPSNTEVADKKKRQKTKKKVKPTDSAEHKSEAETGGKDKESNEKKEIKIFTDEKEAALEKFRKTKGNFKLTLSSEEIMLLTEVEREVYTQMVAEWEAKKEAKKEARKEKNSIKLKLEKGSRAQASDEETEKAEEEEEEAEKSHNDERDYVTEYTEAVEIMKKYDITSMNKLKECRQQLESKKDKKSKTGPKSKEFMELMKVGRNHLSRYVSELGPDQKLQQQPAVTKEEPKKEMSPIKKNIKKAEKGPSKAKASIEKGQKSDKVKEPTQKKEKPKKETPKYETPKKETPEKEKKSSTTDKPGVTKISKKDDTREKQEKKRNAMSQAKEEEEADRQPEKEAVADSDIPTEKKSRKRKSKYETSANGPKTKKMKDGKLVVDSDATGKKSSNRKRKDLPAENVPDTKKSMDSTSEEPALPEERALPEKPALPEEKTENNDQKNSENKSPAVAQKKKKRRRKRKATPDSDSKIEPSNKDRVEKQTEEPALPEGKLESDDQKSSENKSPAVAKEKKKRRKPKATPDSDSKIEPSDKDRDEKQTDTEASSSIERSQLANLDTSKPKLRLNTEGFDEIVPGTDSEELAGKTTSFCKAEPLSPDTKEFRPRKSGTQRSAKKNANYETVMETPPASSPVNDVGAKSNEDEATDASRDGLVMDIVPSSQDESTPDRSDSMEVEKLSSSEDGGITEIVDISRSEQNSQSNSPELVKQDDIMVSPKTSRSNGESSRTPTRTTPVGTPKSGGKTPTSGGRTPRSRTRETKYGVQEGKVLEKLVDKFTKAKSPTASDRRPGADTTPTTKRSKRAATSAAKAGRSTPASTTDDFIIEPFSSSNLDIGVPKIIISSKDIEASTRQELTKSDSVVDETDSSHSKKKTTPEARKKTRRKTKELSPYNETPLLILSKIPISVPSSTEKTDLDLELSTIHGSQSTADDEDSQVERTVGRRSLRARATESSKTAELNLPTRTRRSLRRDNSGHASDTQSQNEASEAEAPARRSTRPKKSTPTIPSVGKPSTSRGRRSLPAALLRDGMESDTSVEEPRLSRSSLLVKGTAEQDKKTTNETSSDEISSQDSSIPARKSSRTSLPAGKSRRSTILPASKKLMEDIIENTGSEQSDTTQEEPAKKSKLTRAALATLSTSTSPPAVAQIRKRHSSDESNTTNNTNASNYSFRKRRSVQPSSSSSRLEIPSSARKSRRLSVSSTESTRVLRNKTK